MQSRESLRETFTFVVDYPVPLLQSLPSPSLTINNHIRGGLPSPSLTIITQSLSYNQQSEILLLQKLQGM